MPDLTLELSMATEKIVVQRRRRGSERRAARSRPREARQARYKQTDHFIHVADRFLQRDQVPLLLGNAEPDQFGLRPLKISVRLTARQLPPLAPQISQVRNAALIERKAVTLPLDHASASSLPM